MGGKTETRHPGGGAAITRPAATRRSGTRTELVWMRPHDHIGWAFDGPEDFACVAEPFLREGVELGERALLVVPDPLEPAYRRLAATFAPHQLEVLSVAAVYGASGTVDPAAQRAAFAATLSQAAAAGYTGIRVAADNSALVQGPEQVEAWMRWEMVADRFISENHVTGLCAFDRRQVDVDTLRHLATLHPLSSASHPLPQFRLFVDDEGFCLEGEVDVMAVDMVERAMAVAPRSTPAALDLRQAQVRGARAKARLRALSARGVVLSV